MARTSSTRTPSASARPRRKLLHERNKIRVTIPKDDGYFYRVANANGDNGFRVQNLLDIGYEIVPHGEATRVGDESVDKPSPIGSNDMSLGKGDRGVLMRIPLEYKQEDDMAKNSLADRQDQTMKDNARSAADYGQILFDVSK
jgi:hypothetical protein